MMKQFPIALLVVILNLFNPITAQTNYYFSTTGDNSSLGTSSEEPWKSFEKINDISASLKPGDSILLKRGDVFRQIMKIQVNGTPGNPVYIGAYGEGENPVLSGSEILSGWEDLGNGKYRAPYSDGQIENLYMNDKQLTIARHPNSGYLKMDKTNGDKGFTSNAVAASGKNWNGAMALVRTNNWTWEKREINSLKPGVIFFDQPTQYECLEKWGFYIFNSPHALDSVYEWYHNLDEGYLYLILPPTQQPGEELIEGTVRSHGMEIDGAYCTITNLTIEKTIESTINTKCEHLTLVNCNLYNSCHQGLKLNGAFNTVKDCKLNNIGGIGIDIRGRSSTIENCQLKNIGLFPELSLTGQQQQVGIKSISSRRPIIRQCTLDSIGYSGILILSDSSVIENNVLTNTMLRLNDGGALYSFGEFARHGVFRNNIIMHVHGYGAATKDGEPKIYPCMYIDNGTNNMLIENNTTAYGGSGIHGNAGSFNNKIVNNISYGNKGSQLSMADWGTHDLISNYLIKDNILVSTGKDDLTYKYICYKETCIAEDRASFDGNYYINPYNPGETFPGNRTYEQWKAEVDTLAKSANFVQQPGEPPKTELLTNPTNKPKTITLQGKYVDLENQPIEQVTLKPYHSMVVVALEKDNTSLSVDSSEKPFQIYPNPAPRGQHIYLKVKGQIPSIGMLYLLDTTGKVLMQQKYEGKGLALDNRIPGGIYFIKLEAGQHIHTSKLIIK